MSKLLKILLIEDSLSDAEILLRALGRAGLKFTAERVDTQEACELALQEPSLDLILSDFSLKGSFDGLKALEMVRERSADIPFIIVSGTIGEDRAVDAMKRGATDYVLKDRMERLGLTVTRALQESKERAISRRAQSALRESEERFRQFMQQLPGRASIRDKEGRYKFVNNYWLRAFGLTAEEVVGKHFQDFMPAERSESLRRIHLQVLQSNKPSVRTFSTDSEDRVQWWLSTHFPIPDVRGGVGMVGTIAIDITGQKIQEDKIARLNRVRVVLSEINAAALRSSDREQLLREACQIAVAHGQFEMACADLIDKPMLEVIKVVAEGEGCENWVKRKIVTNDGIPEECNVVDKAIREKRPVFCNANSADSGTGGEINREISLLGHRSHIALPLFAEDAVVAVLLIVAQEGVFFNDEEVKLLSEISSNISFALDRMEKQEKIDKLLRIRSIFSGINAAAVRIRSRDELCNEVCRIVVEAGKFPFAYLGIVDQEEKRIKPVAHAGRNDGFLDNMRNQGSIDESLPQGHGPAARAVIKKKAIVSNDVQCDPQLLRKQELLERNVNSLAILPLLIDDQAVGVLALHASETGFFDDEEMKLLSEITDDVAFALNHIEKQEKLEYLSYYDPITRLPNRGLFQERLNQSLSRAEETRSRAAVIVIDFRRLRLVNETLGRNTGDKLLYELGQRIQKAWPNPDNIGRVAGDAFAGFVEKIHDLSDIGHLLERILREHLLTPFSIYGKDFSVSVTSGISIFPADGSEADVLIRNAEAALKKAKLNGDRYLFYQPVMNARVAQSLMLENRLRKAIDGDQFVLYYQPRMDMTGERIVGLEALIRWNDPENGLVAPGCFIPVLEETGMILDVGKWAIRNAMAQYKQWHDQGLRPPRIAVNVSAVQLRQNDFVEIVRTALEDHSVGTCGLDLEITESLIMDDVEKSIEKLRAVRNLGVNIAIDDFGTGYSSLGYLTKLPIDALKIDRSFIITMVNTADSMMIVSTVISLAHAMNLKVVAEGVDSEEQRKLLRLLKCDELQGYLFSKPLPAGEVARMF